MFRLHIYLTFSVSKYNTVFSDWIKPNEIYFILTREVTERCVLYRARYYLYLVRYFFTNALLMRRLGSADINVTITNFFFQNYRMIKRRRLRVGREQRQKETQLSLHYRRFIKYVYYNTFLHTKKTI